MNDINKKKLWHALASLTLSGMLLAPFAAEAAPPALTFPAVNYSKPGEAVIQANSVSGAKIELPNGVVTSGYTGSYTTSSNGVYSFTAYRDDEWTTKTVHVTDINKSAAAFRTNHKVPLTLKFTDLISGVKDYRLRNGSTHGWGAWTAVPQQVNEHEFRIDGWSIPSNTPNGDLKIYTQFRDQAGNITDDASEDGGLSASNIPFVLVDFDNKGPTFDFPQQRYYVGPSQNDIVPIKITSVKDGHSDQSDFKIQVSLDGGAYQTFPISDLKNGLFHYSLANRKDGVRTIQLRILDDLGNASKVESFQIFYDMTKPTANPFQVRNADGSALISVKHEGVDMGLVTFDGEDKGIQLHINLLDKFSNGTNGSGFLMTGKDGIARIKITEITKNNAVEEWRPTPTSPRKSRTYQGNELHTLINNGGKFDWELTPGLLKFFEIEMTDNAGNIHKQTTPTFIANGLVIDKFKLKVVNPKQGDELEEDNLVLANANVDVEVTYSFLNDITFDSGVLKEVKGDLVAKIEPATAHPIDTGYEAMTAKIVDGETVMTHTFTVPADALRGAIIKVRGHIRAEFSSGGELYAYFPDKEATVFHEIGKVDGNIDEEVRFKLVR